MLTYEECPECLGLGCVLDTADTVVTDSTPVQKSTNSTLSKKK